MYWIAVPPPTAACWVSKRLVAGVEGLVGDDAVAVGLLGEVAGCVHGVGRPVDGCA